MWNQSVREIAKEIGKIMTAAGFSNTKYNVYKICDCSIIYEGNVLA